MSESKHTPGPWTARHVVGAGIEIMAKVDIGRDDMGGGVLQPIYELGRKPYLRVEDDGSVTMMVTYESWRQFPSVNFQEMQNANAAVIEAAPDMLAALEKIVNDCPCKSGGFEGGEFVAQPCDVCPIARAAIKKARGA